MYRYLLVIVFASLASISATASTSSIDVYGLLKSSDKARGGDINGLRMTSVVSSLKNDKEDKSYTLTIEASDKNNLITFESPARSKGIRMLIMDRNMWFISPDVSKPVPISPRQRLLGDANTGDVATTNYSADYEAKLVREENIEGKDAYVLMLIAKNENVSYAKIRYFIDKETHLGIKAEYLSANEKLLKSSRMYYENSLAHDGKNYSFISKMEIFDSLSANKKTVLHYKDISIAEISPGKFRQALRDK